MNDEFRNGNEDFHFAKIRVIGGGQYLGVLLKSAYTISSILERAFNALLAVS